MIGSQPGVRVPLPYALWVPARQPSCVRHLQPAAFASKPAFYSLPRGAERTGSVRAAPTLRDALLGRLRRCLRADP